MEMEENSKLKRKVIIQRIKRDSNHSSSPGNPNLLYGVF